MLYVPSDLPYNGCYYLKDNYTMRVYESLPTQNTSVNYVDVALDNHYIFHQGVEQFGLDAVIPSCIPTQEITDKYIYRLDYFEILACAMIFFVFFWFILSKCFKVVFRGWV